MLWFIEIEADARTSVTNFWKSRAVSNFARNTLPILT